MKSSADAGQVIAALPFGWEPADDAVEFAGAGGVVGQGEGFATG